jgi:release factor glutamine methyltransferase
VKTIGMLLRKATDRLRAYSLSPRLDAELLLAHILGWSRTRLIAELNQKVGAPIEQQFETLIARRANLEPVAYLIGEWEFYGLPLAVDARVLVSRPETELLVQLAIKFAAELPQDVPLRIGDIGTGSGAIAIAVAAHLPHAHVFATDISQDALDVAATNVSRHELNDRITLLHGDGLQPLPGPVDLLLSNPPYTILPEVDENVRRHEPHLALDGGADGLLLVRRLIEAAPSYLRRGALLMEIGAWQGQAVQEIAHAAFPTASVAVHRDLSGLDRVLDVRVT